MQWLDVVEMEVLPGEHTETIVKVSLEAQIRSFLVRIFLYLDYKRRFTQIIRRFSPNTGNYGPEKTTNLETFHEL